MKKSLVFLLLAAVLFVSCDTQETNYPYYVQGIVKSTETGIGIGSCTVTVGSKSTTTASGGSFSIGLNEAPSSQKIAITKSGYSGYAKLLSYYGGSTITLDLFLKPVDTTVPIDFTTGGVINTVDGAQVTFPSLAGKVTEDLIVSLTNFDVTTDEMLAVSGDFDSDQPDTLIYSAGMIDVDIRGAETGNSYSLADTGLGFEIRIPNISDDPSSSPDTIPMWYFNEATCLWTEEGTFTKSDDDSYYYGTVTHFTLWNADFKFVERTCISGTINDLGGLHGDEFKIELTFNGFYRSYTQTAPDLDFTIINLPRDTAMRLTITAIETRAQWSRSFVTGSGGDCTAIGTIPSGAEADFPEIYGLTYTKTDSSVTFSWTGEASALDHVEIECEHDGIPESSQSIPAGTRTATFAGLGTGVYEFVITAIYPTGESTGIGISVKINVYYMLTIEIDRPDLITVKVSFYINENYYSEIEYTGPMRFPADTIVYLSTYEPDGDYTWCEWEGDVSQNEGYYVDMNSDKTIQCIYIEQPPS